MKFAASDVAFPRGQTSQQRQEAQRGVSVGAASLFISWPRNLPRRLSERGCGRRARAPPRNLLPGALPRLLPRLGPPTLPREWRKACVAQSWSSADPAAAANGLGPGSRGESSGPGLAACSPAPSLCLPAPAGSHTADSAGLPGAAAVARSLLMGGHKIHLFAIP